MKHCCKSSTAQQEPAKFLCSSGIRNLKASLNTVIENIKFIYQIKPGSEEISHMLELPLFPVFTLFQPDCGNTRTKCNPKGTHKPCTAAGNQTLYFSHFITLQGWNNWKWPGYSCAFPTKAKIWRSFRQRLSWQLYNWWSVEQQIRALINCPHALINQLPTAGW